jgi:transcriptional regulator with XRE-family HTH domain
MLRQERRFDLAGFAAAFDAVRQQRRVSRRTVARACDVSPSTFTRLSKGENLTLHSMAALAAWAELDVNVFIMPNEERIQALETVLGDLLDLQNGPPLLKYEADWNAVMQRAEALLGRTVTAAERSDA